MPAIAYPLLSGVRRSFATIEARMNGIPFLGIKSITYSRTRTRGMVLGASVDPLAKTLGENAYDAEAEFYMDEFYSFITALGGDGYGDIFFPVYVSHRAVAGFQSIQDQILGCTIDTTEAAPTQGPDAITRKFKLSPLKIKFGGFDDLALPLSVQATQINQAA